MKCEVCDCEHDGTYGSGKFCSHSCACKYNNPKRSYFGRWKCKYCNNIFNTRNELKQHIKQFHNIYNNRYNKGNHSWNYGLTKDTNIIVNNIAHKIKNMYQNGDLISKNKGRKLSNETKSKISNTMSYINSQKEYKTGRPDVKWYYIQNINNYSYCVRGTWEYNVAKVLNENKILWIRNKKLKYNNKNIIKIYNPDFYLPDIDVYVEVKGWFKDCDIIKMNLVQDQYPNIKIYFIDEKSYFEFIKRNIFLCDDILYINHNKYKYRY